MMDGFDLGDLLNDNDAAEATPAVLDRIVARHRQHRVRRLQAVTAAAVVVVLVASGVAVHIGADNSKVTTAGPSHGPLAAPAGLTWDTAKAPGASSDLPGAIAPRAASAAEPGEFGFGASYGSQSASATGVPLGATAGRAVESGPTAPTACRTKGCDVAFTTKARSGFSRSVDGLTIDASLETFAFPASPPMVPLPPAGVGEGGNTVPKPVVATSTCPATTELAVTVTYKDLTSTLFVPAGGTGTHAFSVVASAAGLLDASAVPPREPLPGGSSAAGSSAGNSSSGSAGTKSGGSEGNPGSAGTGTSTAVAAVLAVARVSPAVTSVSARFASGATDSMRPVEGWVVLGERLPASSNLAKSGAVALQARASSGSLLETATLPASGSLATVPITTLCRLVLYPIGANPVKVALPPPPIEPIATPGPSSLTTTTARKASS